MDRLSAFGDIVSADAGTAINSAAAVPNKICLVIWLPSL